MPIKMIFFMSMILGIIISISSSSWLMAWVGLEINLASFIPLMMSPTNMLPNESALKYFLTQSIASSFLMLNILTAPCPQSWASSSSIMSSMLILLALLLKLGAAPLHFWFPPTMEGLSWMNCILLATIQKIAPLMLIAMTYSPLLPPLALTSALVGAIGGFNQLSLRKIMSYSSIGHLGWLLIIIHFTPSIFPIYLLMYIYLSSLVMHNFMQKNTFNIPQIMNQTQNKNALISSLNILSLGGLPPFLGFLPKWIVIQTLAQQALIIAPGILIISSLITLFYYIRIIYSITTNHNTLKISSIKSQPNSLLLWSLPSIFSLPLFLPVLMY